MESPLWWTPTSRLTVLRTWVGNHPTMLSGCGICNAGTRRVGMVRIVAVDSFQSAVTSVQDVGYCCPQRASIKATTPCVGTSYGMFAVLVRSKGSKPPNHQLVTLPTSTIHHCPDIHHYNLSPNASCLLHETTTSIIFYFFFFFQVDSLLVQENIKWVVPMQQ